MKVDTFGLYDQGREGENDCLFTSIISSPPFSESPVWNVPTTTPTTPTPNIEDLVSNSSSSVLSSDFGSKQSPPCDSPYIDELRLELTDSLKKIEGNLFSTLTTISNSSKIHLKQRFVYQQPPQIRWKGLGNEIPWKSIMETVNSHDRTHFEGDLYMKLLLRKLPVNHYIRNSSKGPITFDTRKCPLCMQEDETIEHFLVQCTHAITFWDYISTLLSKLLKVEVFESRDRTRDIVFFFPRLLEKYTLTQNQLHILTVVHSVALWGLWSGRSLKLLKTDSDSTSFDLTSNVALLFFETRLKARIQLEYQSSSESEKMWDCDIVKTDPDGRVGLIFEK